jgi:MFS family permease
MMTAVAPPPPITHSPEAEAAVVRKVMWRLIPFLVLLYLFNYIDRVNVGIAKLGMQADPQLNPGLGNGGALTFSDPVYSFGVWAFFISYFLFEIPSNLIQEKVGPRRWIARIMISWGLVSACFMFVRGPWSFYILRFLLGVAEAGFFPGIILYLSYWIPPKQRARASALFLTSIALSGVIGNPLGGFILYSTAGLGALRGWQWLFLIEGIPTIILGFVVLFYLTDYPKDAHWLSDEERAILTARMAHERHGHAGGHASQLRHAFTSPIVWLLGVLYGMMMFGFYVINYWTPTFAKQALTHSHAISADTPNYVADLYTGLLAAIPFTAAAIGMVVIGHHSDRTGERRWHVAISAIGGAAGLTMAGYAPLLFGGVAALVVTLAGLSIAGIGIWGTLGPFWTMPPQLLTGAAAAAGIALINSIGNLFGGSLGSWLIGVLKEATHSDLLGLLIAAGTLVLAACVIALVKVNQPRDEPKGFPVTTESECGPGPTRG